MSTNSDVSPGASTREQLSAASGGFRKDINGLRALAVVSVALDHAKIHYFSGGFVGVDVFFVVSGFLITQLLVAEAQRTGSIALLRFYNRRAKRILPAATLVIAATVIASVLLLSYVQSTAVIQDSLWATFFAANIRFSSLQTNYFAANDPVSALQHFWSLAVEEQFYVVWPLLLALLVGALFVQRRRAGRATTHRAAGMPRGRVLAVLGLLGGASLAWSVVLTDRNPTAAYFSTFARAWELAVGAAVALLVPTISAWPSWVKAAMAWTGLFVVGASIVSYSSSTPYPGDAALAPVLGAALIIAGGCGPVRGGSVLLLGNWAAQRIGEWSYSFYLWHWPFLVIAAAYVGHALSPTQNFDLLLAALALSIVTYYGVENPIRRSKGLSVKVYRGLLLYPAAVACTLAACLTATGVIHYEVAQASSDPAITLGNFGVRHESGYHLSRHRAVAIVEASVIAARHGMSIPGQTTPSVLGLAGDKPAVGACDYVNNTRQLCRLGDVSSKKVLVAFGDSHARAWIPALDIIAQKEGYAAYYLVKPACGDAQLVPSYNKVDADACLAWRAWAIRTIRTLHPDVTLLAQALPPAIVQANGATTHNPRTVTQAFTVGLRDTISQLGASAGRIVVMGDAPGLRQEPGICLSRRGATLASCASSRTQVSYRFRRANRTAAHRSGVSFIDPSRWFCAYRLCPAVIGSTIAYRDREHMSTTYAAELAGPLAAALQLSSRG